MQTTPSLGVLVEQEEAEEEEDEAMVKVCMRVLRRFYFQGWTTVGVGLVLGWVAWSPHSI